MVCLMQCLLFHPHCHYEGNFALGVAKTTETPPKITKPNPKNQGTTLPISTLATHNWIRIPLGWDYENKRWYSPIWTNLDTKLDLSKDDKTTKWKLDWKTRD